MRLVADANVLLSAIIGGRARALLDHPSVSAYFTTEHTIAEVFEYAGRLGAKRGLRIDTVMLEFGSLPATIVARAAYEDFIPEATRRIGKRDPDDVDVRALALHLDAAVWSNDNDWVSL